MICFKCDSEEFEVRESSVHQEFRGEAFDVRVPVSVCKGCGWQVLAPDQVDAVRKQTVDAYRSKHKLLMAKEIIMLRKARSMSQEKFAEFVGVGVASIKRWERGFVQEPISDKRIREKCGFYMVQYTTPKSFKASEGMVVFHGNSSINNLWTNSEILYTSSPIRIQSNFSKLTNHVSGDAKLAETSKNWRNKHAKKSSNVYDWNVSS
jgi:putative zinc finger/helix-turn-helix YgiT family protein